MQRDYIERHVTGIDKCETCLIEFFTDLYRDTKSQGYVLCKVHVHVDISFAKMYVLCVDELI